jgi:FMN reductase
MSDRTLAVVSAGLRVPSSTRLLADQLATASVDALRLRGIEADRAVIELRDHAHDLTNHLLTGFPAAPLRTAIDTVTEADGLVVVSPIFNASYSGLFKTFFDVLDADALAGKPVLIAATGGSARHSLALEHAMRPLFAYLRAVAVPTAVYAATEDWGGDHAGALSDRIERAADELAALVAARELIRRTDPFDEPTPFAQLLTGA